MKKVKPGVTNGQLTDEFAQMVEKDARQAVAEDWDPYQFLADYPKRPRWSNEQALIALVSELRDDELETERQFYTDIVPNLPGLPAAAGSKLRNFVGRLRAEADAYAAAALERRAHGWCSPDEERRAIVAANRGDCGPLARLVADGNRLSPECGRLAAEFIRGERTKTGRPRGKKGAPKLSNSLRRAQTPTHEAAEEFEAIRDMLLVLYPEQSGARGEQINVLAERIAQERTGATASVVNYKKRSKKAAQRLR